MGKDIFPDLFGLKHKMPRGLLAFLKERLPECCFQMLGHPEEQGIIGAQIVEMPEPIRSDLIQRATTEKQRVHRELQEEREIFAAAVEEMASVLIFSIDRDRADQIREDGPGQLVQSYKELFFTLRALQDAKDHNKNQREQLENVIFVLRARYQDTLAQNCKQHQTIQAQQSEYTKRLKTEIDHQTAQLRDINEQLQAEIRERESAIARSEEMARQAEKAYQAQSRFLANMSHEIRTPLNAILGFTDMLADAGLSGKHHDYVTAIGLSGRALLNVINDILDYSKIEADKIDLERVAFDVSTLVREVGDILAVNIANKGLALHTRLAPRMGGRLVGDPGRLRQILLNLVGNAVKFTERGQILIAVRVEDETPCGVRVQFAVEDEGIGMSTENIERIFSAFSQADGSTTRKYGGSGLGLVISNRLVKLMGGERIFVTSEVGRGSRFYFSLPFQKGEISAQEAQAELARPHADAAIGSYRILLVEDNPQNIKFATALFTEKGHTVVVAQNGQLGVEAAMRAPFDVILMDIQMPVMGGLEAAGILRAKGNRTPIVAMTAGDLKGDRERCLAAGMNGFIAKPIHIQSLDGMLTQIITARTTPYSDPAADSPGEPVMADGVYPAPVIRREETLERLGGSRYLYQILLREFLKSTGRCVRDIQNAFQQQDMNLAHRLVHTLKGAAANISATALYEAANMLLMAIKEKTPEPVAGMTDRVQSALRKTREAVSMEMKALAEERFEAQTDAAPSDEMPTDGPGIDGKPAESEIRRRLCELNGFLDDGDLVAAQNSLTAIQASIDGPRFDADIRRIERHIRAFDFDAAKRNLNHIAAFMGLLPL